MKRKNKKLALIFLFIVFLGIVSPFQNVALGADPIMTGILGSICPPCAVILLGGGVVDSVVANTARGFINGALGMIATIPAILLGISQNLLSAVISPNFLGISMTGPDNVVVAYGWGITRDLANICLLLGLVVIGLGVILGLEEYQAKKTLPKLIAIALLINFTLVICGFILDFANLLMNYLLGAGSLGKGLTNEIQNGMASFAGQDLSNSVVLVLTFFIFGMVAAIVYALYALLFIARYVYLWILIIISPIAFASKVFPSLSQAKQFFPSFFHWDEWWKSFIQWATVGIYAAFFIALANRLMTAMASGAIVTTKLSALGAIFSYLFPLALLLIGFFSVLDAGSSVPGFSKVVGLGKTAAIGAAAVTAGVAAGAYAGAAAVDDQGRQRTIRERATGAFTGAVTSGGREEGLTSVRRSLEQVPVFGRAIGGPGAADRDRESKINKAREEIKKIPNSPAGNRALQRGLNVREVTQGDYYKRMARMEALAERSAPDDRETERLIARYAPEYQRHGYDSDNILTPRPDLAEHFHDADGQALTIEGAVNRINPEDAPKIRREAYAMTRQNATPEEIERTRRVAAAMFADERKVNNLRRRIRRDRRLELRDSAHDALATRDLPIETSERILDTINDPNWN